MIHARYLVHVACRFRNSRCGGVVCRGAGVVYGSTLLVLDPLNVDTLWTLLFDWDYVYKPCHYYYC